MSDEKKKPGFFRRLFSGFTRGEPEKPEAEAPAPEKAPAKKAPVKKAPAKKAPAKKAPAKKAPAKKAPAKKAPAKKAPAKKAPAKKAPAKKAPAKKTPAKKTPAKKAPAKKAPVKKAPAKKTPPPQPAEKPEPGPRAPAKREPPQKAPPDKGPSQPVRRAAAPSPAPEPKPAPAPAQQVSPAPEPARAPPPPPVIAEPPEPKAPAPAPETTARFAAPETAPTAEPPPAAPPPPEVPEPPAPPPPAEPPSIVPPVTKAKEQQPAPDPDAKPEKKGWFRRLREGLTRSSTQLTENITAVFTKRRLDEDALQELEDVLIGADLGVDTAMTITEAVGKGRYNKEVSPEEVSAILAAEVEKVLEPVAKPLEISASHKPHVILVVGVNGTGKTTTIGKLAAKFRAEGKSVLMAAGDTFRAAAIEQLGIWGERSGADVLARALGADAAGLAYDAIKQARDNGTDVVLIDTAGRLQNKADLMAELEKIVRVTRKLDETAPHDVVLVLDATTGQNAVQQVDIFRNVAGVTGIIMTKLDGTARGGILVAIAAKFGLPVHAIGVGETVDDLQPFAAGQFARAIAGVEATADA